MFELLFKHGLDHCKFIIKAACFITELGHYSWALCTIFSKPIRARWRAPAHPRKDGIFTFQHRTHWILIWLLWFNTAALLSVSHELPNGFVNVLRDFCHYPGLVSSGRCDESHQWSLFSVAEPLPPTRHHRSGARRNQRNTCESKSQKRGQHQSEALREPS